jgi:hypothetical protein
MTKNPSVSNDAPLTHKTPNILAILDQLSARAEVSPDARSKIVELRSLLTPAAPAQNRPFMSVLLRTQGHRLESLRDSLLCLAGQSSQDFELILLCHNATVGELEAVRQVVDSQVPSFRGRITVVPVEGGSRATPLNAGLTKVQGMYVAVFDDDDLLFAHWLESFEVAAQRSPGMLLRSQVASQQVAAENWSMSKQGYRSTSWPATPYSETLDLAEHLVVSQTPFMSVAFPEELFSVYGVRFDENLDVCEDWDVILQGSILLGVEDVPELTSIYRMWTGAVSSYTKHSQSQWERSEAAVVSRLNENVVMLPAGAVERLRFLAVADERQHEYSFMFNEGKLRLPFSVAVKVLSPFIIFIVRGRNFLRRRLSRS